MHLRSCELPGGANNTLETVRFAGRQKQTSYRAHIERALREPGLRISRQRVVLAELLDQSERRRVTAEALYSDALKARCEVSRATVSHTLRQLELAGMLKRVAVPGSKKAWFVVERPIIGREHARREIGRFEAT